MDYTTYKRFKGKAICGEVNIPAMSKCEVRGGLILWRGLPICYATSENAHQHFARNDDGRGLERGRLTQEIQSMLAKRDKAYQARWDRVWSDPLCQKYKRTEQEDYWLWNHDFYSAPIYDLQHIKALIKGGK